MTPAIEADIVEFLEMVAAEGFCDEMDNNPECDWDSDSGPFCRVHDRCDGAHVLGARKLLRAIRGIASDSSRP